MSSSHSNGKINVVHRSCRRRASAASSGLICAMTHSTICTPAGLTSTEVRANSNHCRSGGETWISATVDRQYLAPEKQWNFAQERRDKISSPLSTAFRTFAPMNHAFV
ncbi:MAG: hypothetical protein IPJ30_00010 [Acidobacteria bacterium]|nr:hypothetical protein [Acidobacteriota bacterium]